MKVKLTLILLAIFFLQLVASDHGIYLLTNKNVKGSINEISKQVVEKLIENGFNVQYNDFVKSPDYVREDSSEHCGYKSKLIVFTSEDYNKLLTEYGSKYLVAGFSRIGIFETPSGLMINIADPETINRIVFNDLYENDQTEKYSVVIEKSQKYKGKILTILHSLNLGENVEVAMEPIRDYEDLAESSKDMFMMVGPMTLFTDEDQFPLIYSIEDQSAVNLRNELIENLKKQSPQVDDVEYRWTPESSDLHWKLISEITSRNKKAIVLGLTRNRTEAVSFHIAGRSREEDDNLCPGIDHAAAYPIEILIIEEKGNTNVYMQAEMLRMDMYFWDAGMAAFMDHMSMPGILDESIKKALLGSKYIED